MPNLMNRFAGRVALMATLGLPNAALAQTTVPGDAATPGNPPATMGPAPVAGPVPAEVMPQSASHDPAFVATAAAGGLAAIRMGQLAEQKAQSAQARTFARRMVADHTKLGQRLAAIAQRVGVSLPTQPDTKDLGAIADLSGLSGASFDTAYLRTQVADHETALSAFRQEAEHGTDPDLKAFAQATLPLLREHLQMAKDAEKRTS